MDVPTAAIAVVSFGLLLWKKIPNQFSLPLAASPESCCTDPGLELPAINGLYLSHDWLVLGTYPATSRSA